jgi:peptidyl-prolyl cis-trans isomerase A (cyclophilin A)
MSLFRSAVFAAGFLTSWAVCSGFPQQLPQSLPDAPSAQTQTAPQSAPQSAPSSTSAQSLPDSPDTQVHPSLQPTGPTVLFETSMGRMTCRLFDKQAPEAAANFVGLAQGTKEWTDPATKQKVRGKPYYDGTTFHRVIPEFMIQGGDPMGTGMGDPGYMFKDEFDPDLNFDVAGRLAMANSGPDTNGSQFFITEVPQPQLDQHYTIFGQCDDASVWVVKAIARVNRDSNDKPIEAVVLKKVTIIPAGQPVPAAPGPAAAGSGPTGPSGPTGASGPAQPQF